MGLVDWPVGTDEERSASAGSLPGHWQNSNPFLNWYKINDKGEFNYHTGVDLNLNYPHWNDDWHTPILALADGVVTFAGLGGGSWGHIIVVQSIDPRTYQPFYWRVGHIESPEVITAMPVTLAEPIARVGNGDGYYGQGGAHLHLDISLSRVLLDKPNYWPGANEQAVLDNFVDPAHFIKDRYVMEPVTNPETTAALREALAKLPGDFPVTVVPGLPTREPLESITAYIVKASDLIEPMTPDPIPAPITKYATVEGLNIRSGEGTSYPIIGTLHLGVAVTVIATNGQWDTIVSPMTGYVYNGSLSKVKPVPNP
jgi:hypothetical protein